MFVQLLTRSYKQMIGLARYTCSLRRALEKAGIQHTVVQPNHPFPLRLTARLCSPLGWDLTTFFTTYPLAAALDKHALTHFTAQQMAFLLWLRRDLGPVVVTVHDIVPFLVRHNGRQSTFRHPLDRWFDGWAMRGLGRATSLIAVSRYTRKTLVEGLDYPAEKIVVVHQGVNHDIFHPRAVPGDFYRKHGLSQDHPYLLYVGSENPRKNLPRLLGALDLVRHHFPDIRLIKVGSPEYLPQAQALNRLVDRLGVEDHVLFFDHLSDADLACFYNLADLFLFPSLYEGFGLPVLEAMACGTPVITSNTSSLPEVAGDAALLVDPTDVVAIAAGIGRVLQNPDLARDLRQRGLARAAHFSWEKTARQTIAVYEQLLGRSL